MTANRISPRCVRTVSPGVRRFIGNALCLIGLNLFMRTVGVTFNVYLSDRAGSEVMGLYSLIFGVYGLCMTLGCGGIHLGTTRMIADVLGGFCPVGKGPREDSVEGCACRAAIRMALRRCVSYAVVCSVGAGLLMLAGSRWLGEVWLGDARTVLALRVLALSLPAVAVSACFGGYFTAVRRVAPSAVAGIGVQFLRIGLCAYLLTLWLPDGVEMTCLALVLGGALSEIGALIFHVLVYLWDRQRHLTVIRERALTVADLPTEAQPTVRKLLGITVPVTLSACLRSGLLTLQHSLIPKGLKASGASWQEALASYGVVHSLVLPVVLFPSAFISSFSGLLVPEVAESYARGDGERIARLAWRVITPALIFSFGVAGIMACFGYELGEAIYGNREAGHYIHILAPLIPIMYVDSSVDAFLKGMGEQVYSMNVNIADALSSVILVWLLLPRMGLGGYIIAIYATETLNTTLSLARMLRITGMPVRLWRQIFGPLLCIIGATTLVRVGGTLLHRPIASVASLILHISLCIGVYLGLLLITGVLRRSRRA